MALQSTIEWTESTWNPVTGCSKVSPGCKNCYAERMAKRLQAMGQPNYRNGFRVTIHPKVLLLPLAWRRPQSIFVNSMSDLFHEAIPEAFIRQIFETMMAAPRHRFQILTKRSERLRDLAGRLPWGPHVWVGVTVECSDVLHRIDHLKVIPAYVKFLSIEPMLGPLPNLNLEGINWVIVGGESGPGARPVNRNWVVDVRNQCLEANLPFFFKQWGGTRKKKNGRELDGRTWDQMPNMRTVKLTNQTHYRIQEFENN
jgi:protein gp37